MLLISRNSYLKHPHQTFDFKKCNFNLQPTVPKSPLFAKCGKYCTPAKKLTGTRLSFTPSVPPANVRSFEYLSDLVEDVPYFSRDEATSTLPPNYSHVEKFMKDAVRKAVLKTYDRDSYVTMMTGSTRSLPNGGSVRDG